MEKSQDESVITVNGSGEQTRDFIFVSDAVNAIIQSARVRNGIYNIGTGKPTSLTQMLSIIREMNGNPAINFKKEIKGDIRHSHADMSLTKKTFTDWKPKYGIREGMKIFNQWLKAVR